MNSTAASDAHPGLEFAGGTVWGAQIAPILFAVVIESIAVIRAITDEMLRLGLQHGELETELDQRDFMMIGRMRTHGEQESLSIHNREDLHALATFRESDRLAATLRRGKCRINATLPLVDNPFVAQRIPQLRKDLSQHLVLARPGGTDS